MIKELVMDVISKMPDNASIEEILDAIILRLSINAGLNDIENGNVVSHEDLLEEIKTW